MGIVGGGKGDWRATDLHPVVPPALKQTIKRDEREEGDAATDAE